MYCRKSYVNYVKRILLIVRAVPYGGNAMIRVVEVGWVGNWKPIRFSQHSHELSANIVGYGNMRQGSDWIKELMGIEKLKKIIPYYKIALRGQWKKPYGALCLTVLECKLSAAVLIVYPPLPGYGVHGT